MTTTEDQTEYTRALKTLFAGKEYIFDIIGWDPAHMVSHLRFQPDQEFIDEFYNTLSSSDDEYAQKIFTIIKTDIDTVIYKYLKNHAYDTSVPNELKIELDGTKFIISFLDTAIYTVDKRFRTVYGSKFTYLPYLFYVEDGKVVVEENDDSVEIEIYYRDNLVETHTLKPVLEEDETKPLETRPPEVYILNRVFKNTSFHKSFMEWVNKDPVLTPYDVKFLVATFLITYSNQEMVDDFYETSCHITFDKDKEAVEFILSIKKEISRLLYDKVEPYAYEKNRYKYELKIELIGIKFLFTFLDFRICTLDNKYQVEYFPKIKGIQHMFEKDTKVTIENMKVTAELIRINIYYGKSSEEKEYYTLVYNDTSAENSTRFQSVIMDKVLKHTDIYETFLEWVERGMTFIEKRLYEEDQEFIDEFYDACTTYLQKNTDEQVKTLFEEIKQNLGKRLYRDFKQKDKITNFEFNNKEYEMIIELDGTYFLFNFLEGRISTLDKCYTVFYGSKIKGLQYLCNGETAVVKTDGYKVTIIIALYSMINRSIYELSFTKWDSTNRIQKLDNFILNFDKNQNVLNFFVNYKLSEEEIKNGRIHELNHLAYPNIMFLTKLKEFTGIGDGDVLCGVIYKIICRFQDKNHKINGKFIWEYLNDPKVETTELERAKRVEVLFTERKAAQERIRTLISEVSSNLIECPICKKDDESQESYRRCDYDCGTVCCSCENEYHILNNKSVPNHNPACYTIIHFRYMQSFPVNGVEDPLTIRDNTCGEDESEDSDVDSVKEYREATELHTKIMSEFFVRKRIFRHEFNSDAIIKDLNLSEDVKECIFKEFDEFSDRFSAVYKGTKSFLPYRYLFFKLLRNAGFPYTYECTFQKMKAMEKIYWSLKDAKDYEEFIRFLNNGVNIVCEKEYNVFDSPKKIVISEFKHSLKEAYYLLTVKDELDLVKQYFTKFLPKIKKRPEYQYNLIIMEMEEEKMEITFESIFLYIVDELNERMNLNVMFMIKEEIN